MATLSNQAQGLFGTPLVVRVTFLQFHFERPGHAPRCHSAPPRFHAPLRPARPAPEQRNDAKGETAQREGDDEAALREGRGQTLCETWGLLAKGLLAAASAERRDEVVRRTPRHRITLTSGGFAQTAIGLGYSPEDLLALSRLGVLRVDDEKDTVEIWAPGERLQSTLMRELLAEAEAVRDLSREFFFVHGDVLFLVVRYRGRRKVGELKRQICTHLTGVTPCQIHLGVMGDEDTLSDDGARLVATSVRPGCCLRCTQKCARRP